MMFMLVSLTKLILVLSVIQLTTTQIQVSNFFILFICVTNLAELINKYVLKYNFVLLYGIFF